jgi:hypothetical protein
MGFTLPLALVGLAAAALPVVVHLIRRRDLPTVPLPTLALLMRARVASRRRLRVVDLLLLACRVMLLAVLAVAVAGPYVHSQLPWGDGRVSSVAIVIDDSMSMGRRDDGGTPLARARARARAVIGSLPEGSEVTVVLAGDAPRVLMPLSGDLHSARERVSGLPDRTARGTALREAMLLAVHELDGARHAARRLLILSDFARHALDEALPIPERLEVTAERMGGEAVGANLAVESATAVPDPTQPGHVSVRVTVRGFGADDGPITLALRRGEEELARQRASLAGGAARAVLHAPMPDGAEDPTAHVVLVGHDALPTDDRRGVLLRPPNVLRVLVVNGDPHPDRHQDEVGFLTRAFDVAPAEHGSIAYQVVDPDAVDVRVLGRMDVVVLANVPVPSPPVARALTEFVHGGGGLLVAPGHRADPRAYAARLGPVLAAHPAATTAGPEGAGLRAATDSPALPAADSGLHEVATHRRWLLDAPSAGPEVLLRFADQAPALAVVTHGQGRSALLATPLDDDWSDLPFRPGFVPLTLGLVRHLAARERLPERPFLAGAMVPIPVASSVLDLRVVAPDGTEHVYRGTDLVDPLEYLHTEVPGAYRVLVRAGADELRDDARAAFVVAPPLAESDLTPAEVPVTRGGAARGRAASATPSIVRRSIAPWFFLLAGFLAVLEALLRYHRAAIRPPARSRSVRAG